MHLAGQLFVLIVVILLTLELPLQLAYLPDKRRDLVLEDDDDAGLGGELESREGKDGIGTEDSCKDEKKAIKKRGMLAWFKLRVCV